MAVYGPKHIKITAARRTAFTPAQPNPQPPAYTVSGTDVLLEVSNEALKLEQTIQVMASKVLLMEPMVTKLHPFTYPHKTSETQFVNVLLKFLGLSTQYPQRLSSET